jgi:hypothetical protein
MPAALPSRASLYAALRLAAGFAIVKLLLQFALTLWGQHVGYSYFRDELYYILCGRHLAWGYVDQGPLVAVQARVGEALFGDSVFAIRILSALAGAIAVFLTGMIAWALNGLRAAQSLAMLALICCPMYISLDGFLSMNSWEPVFWMSCVLVVVLLLRDLLSARTAWLIFGVSAGLGLLNKPSMAFFLIALGIGLLCTSSRRILFSRWAAVGIGLFVLVALPNLFWQMHHHWATLDFLRSKNSGDEVVKLAPWSFFVAQIMNFGPLMAVLWVPGVVALLSARSMRGMRWLGITFVAFFAMMMAMHAKDYYLAPVYPAFYAAGAIAWDAFRIRRQHVYARRDRIFGFPIFESILLVGTVIILPLASPVLRPATWVRYANVMHQHGDRSETHATGPLPQFYADRFGWTELTTAVVHAFTALTPEQQQHACIFTSNYGEASAIEFLAPRMYPSTPLPPVISGHNNYYLWGRRGCDGSVLLAVVGDTPAQIHEHFVNVSIVGHQGNPWSMPYEQKNIYLVTGRNSVPWLWADRKHYD